MFICFGNLRLAYYTAMAFLIFKFAASSAEYEVIFSAIVQDNCYFFGRRRYKYW